MNETQLQFETPDSGEEAARAELYGLLSMLFYQAPTPDLLAALAHGFSPPNGALAQAPAAHFHRAHAAVSVPAQAHHDRQQPVGVLGGAFLTLALGYFTIRGMRDFYNSAKHHVHPSLSCQIKQCIGNKHGRRNDIYPAVYFSR